MNTLFIIRGVSGSGKSTLAELLGFTSCEADNFFLSVEDEYKFNPEQLKEAHEFCKNCVEDALAVGWEKIAVANTFTQEWEYAPYIELAEQYGYTPFVITCENNFGNVHNVPEEVIEKQRARFEPRKFIYGGTDNA